MKLTVLGSGTSVIRSERKGPAFLLEVAGQKLLFDCGWGAPGQLLATGHDPQDLDHVFISHPHADHLGTLMTIVQSIPVSGLFYPETKRNKPLYLNGYTGFAKDYATLRQMMLPEQIETYPLNVEDAMSRREYDGFTVEAAEVPHVEFFHSAAFRVESDGKVFAYSGDCGANETLIRLSQGADLAVFDASVSLKRFEEGGPRSNHMSPIECSQIAEKAGVKQLLLFSLYDHDTPEQLAQAMSPHFSGKIVIPNDLDVFSV